MSDETTSPDEPLRAEAPAGRTLAELNRLYPGGVYLCGAHEPHAEHPFGSRGWCPGVAAPPDERTSHDSCCYRCKRPVVRIAPNRGLWCHTEPTDCPEFPSPAPAPVPPVERRAASLGEQPADEPHQHRLPSGLLGSPCYCDQPAPAPVETDTAPDDDLGIIAAYVNTDPSDRPYRDWLQAKGDAAAAIERLRAAVSSDDLRSALRRVTENLENFVAHHPDPGSEALGAIHCARALLASEPTPEPKS